MQCKEAAAVVHAIKHCLVQNPAPFNTKTDYIIIYIEIHSITAIIYWDGYIVIIMRANAEYIILEFHVLCCVHAYHYNIHHSDSKYINVVLHTKETSGNIDQSHHFLEEQQRVFQLEVTWKSPIVSAE